MIINKGSGSIDRNEFETLYQELRKLGYQIGTIDNALRCEITHTIAHEYDE